MPVGSAGLSADHAAWQAGDGSGLRLAGLPLVDGSVVLEEASLIVEGDHIAGRITSRPEIPVRVRGDAVAAAVEDHHVVTGDTPRRQQSFEPCLVTPGRILQVRQVDLDSALDIPRVVSGDVLTNFDQHDAWNIEMRLHQSAFTRTSEQPIHRIASSSASAGVPWLAARAPQRCHGLSGAA